MKRKIATSVSVRINVGNFQHIELSKYAEGEIEFENEDARQFLEDELHSDILADLIRNMRELPERLGKKTDAVPVFEESIKKTVPEWMQSNIEPNIAKQKFDKKNAEVKSKAIEEKDEMESLLEKEVAQTVADPNLTIVTHCPKDAVESEKEEEKKEEKEEEKEETQTTEETLTPPDTSDDLSFGDDFDADDLFE